MKRIGFTLKLKAELLDAYRAHHRDVWPELRAALSGAGWHNYTLFLRQDGLLFGYFETPESLAAAQAAMAETEVNARWQALMAPFFEFKQAGARPDAQMVALEEVFHLD